MSLSELIVKYPSFDAQPGFWRHVDPEVVQRHLESLFWRRSGYGAMVRLPIEQVEAFLAS